MITFELVTVGECPSLHPEDGRQCERLEDHVGEHWYTVREGPDHYGDFEPAYPVRWKEDDSA